MLILIQHIVVLQQNTWNDGFRSYGVGSSDDLTASTKYLIAQSARENSIKFRNLSIHGAKWGIYALCNYLSVEDCKFYNCGWSGDIGTYDSNANFFYGSDGSTSTDPSSLTGDGENTIDVDTSSVSYSIVDGGGIFFNSRIIDDSMNGSEVNYNPNNITNLSSNSTTGNTSGFNNRKNNSIKNNIFNYSNEGIHVLHTMNMEISNNKFCKNMGKCITNKYSYKTQINKNFIEACFNTSIMLLNCFKTSIIDNNIYDVWNCGICCISSTHTLIQNNNLTDINERSYNGYVIITSYAGVVGYGSNNNHLNGVVVLK